VHTYTYASEYSQARPSSWSHSIGLDSYSGDNVTAGIPQLLTHNDSKDPQGYIPLVSCFVTSSSHFRVSLNTLLGSVSTRCNLRLATCTVYILVRLYADLGFGDTFQGATLTSEMSLSRQSRRSAATDVWSQMRVAWVQFWRNPYILRFSDFAAGGRSTPMGLISAMTTLCRQTSGRTTSQSQVAQYTLHRCPSSRARSSCPILAS